MTLFTGRGRHHSSSRGGGAWGQCCQVEQLRPQPSWNISLWALTAPLGFSVFRLSIRSPAVAEERASFLDRRHIARVHSRTSTDISAIPDVDTSRSTRRRAAARSTPLRPSLVASLSWPDRRHHVPALTVTSGGRGVGFDMHAWGRLAVLRRQFNSSFYLLRLSGLRFLAYISTRRAALSCVRTEGITRCKQQSGAKACESPKCASATVGVLSHGLCTVRRILVSEWPRASCSSSHVGEMSGHTTNSLVALGSACWWLLLVWLSAGASGVCFLVFLALVLLAGLGASGFLFLCMRATGSIVSAAASGC